MKRKTKINIVGLILISILGFLKWRYPKQSSFITSGFGGLVAVLFSSYLAFYPLMKDEENK